MEIMMNLCPNRQVFFTVCIHQKHSFLKRGQGGESKAVQSFFSLEIHLDWRIWSSLNSTANMLSPHQSQLLETAQGSIKRCNNHPDNLGCANLQTMPKHSAQHKLHRKDAMLQAAGSIMQEVGEKLTETNSRLCMCRRHNRPIIHIFFTLSLFLLCFSFSSVSFLHFALPTLL